MREEWKSSKNLPKLRVLVQYSIHFMPPHHRRAPPSTPINTPSPTTHHLHNVPCPPLSPYPQLSYTLFFRISIRIPRDMGVVFEANDGERRAAAGPLEDFIERAGGCAVIDGGFATQLELHGASINDPLWSALCLINSPHLISKVHLEYLEAGADILVTSSYQATLPGFISRGLSLEEAEKLLEKSVKLATKARDDFWDAVKHLPEHSYNRALVAASVGSYGAFLADGSEYSGDYGPDVDLKKIKDFHRRRLQVLVAAGPDLLAFETIPNRLEAQAVAELLEEEDVGIPSWVCFSSVDGVNAPSGESFEACLDAINQSPRIAAAGINCAPPQFVHALVQKLKELTEKVIVVYPNSGETWDGVAKKWLPSKCFNDNKLEVHAARWRDSGAKLIGGCCRTTPSTTRALSRALKPGFLTARFE